MQYTIVQYTHMDLFTDTQKLVADSNLSYRTIANHTGLGERWLRRYMKGDYQDVGVRRLQKLRDYLLSQRIKY